MAISWSGVEWDEGNRTKCQKHGVSIDDIEYALFHSLKLVFPDIHHSADEDRYVALGNTRTGRDILTILTLRITGDGKVHIRPVSARFMHRKEVEKYEQEIDQQGEKIS
jgi:uncharacterized protein